MEDGFEIIDKGDEEMYNMARKMDKKKLAENYSSSSKNKKRKDNKKKYGSGDGNGQFDMKQELQELESLKKSYKILLEKEKKELVEVSSIKKSIKNEYVEMKKLKIDYQDKALKQGELNRSMEELQQKFKTELDLLTNKANILLKSHTQKLQTQNSKCVNVASKYEKEYQKLEQLHRKIMKLDTSEKKDFGSDSILHSIKNSFSMSNVDKTKDLDIITQKAKTYQKLNEFVRKNRELNEKIRKSLEESKQIEKQFEDLQKLKNKQAKLIDDTKIQLNDLKKQHLLSCIVKLPNPTTDNPNYHCISCNTDIGTTQDIESQSYQVGQGAFTEKKRGYLFKQAYNVVLSDPKPENFTTGTYNISWAKCVKCDVELGWKYVSAEQNLNSEKVGKFCLARYKLKPTNANKKEPKKI